LSSNPPSPIAGSPDGDSYPPNADVDSQPATASAASPQQRVVAIANDRPEAAVGAAFAGGLLLALILKRLAR
jgi:hypothetical protein